MQVKLGITDRTVTVFIPDPASTDGSGKTGLTHADLTVSYTRTETDNDVVVTDVTSSLSTLTALTDAHTDWGVKEVSSTLAPGLYRLDIADAVFAAGAWEAVVYVMITTSAAAASPIKFELIAYDPLDAQLGFGSRLLGSTTVTNLNTIFDTDYAGIYNTTAKCFLAQLDNGVTHGGDEAKLQLGSTSTVPLIIANSGGDAVQFTASGGNGDALQLAAHGTGSAILATGGATGHGASFVGGATSGNGILATGTAGNSAAMSLVGQGSAAGLLSTGGATGDGIRAVGGATSGDGIDCMATTSGAGMRATGAGNVAGISTTGNGTASGLLAQGGSTGSGIFSSGGATSGYGMICNGSGAFAGLAVAGGDTGVGVLIVGGGTSGDGVSISTTSGHGVNIAPVGTAKHGVQIAGGNGATSDGINVAAGTGGVAIRSASTTVTGATTYTGNVSMAAGLTVAQSSLNSPAILVTGNGTAAGVDVTGGATGDGITVAAGGGSGRALHLGSITVDGTSVLTGAVSMGSTFAVSGTVTLNALTVTNATTLSGAVALGSTLAVTGAFTATNASNDIRGIALHATQAAYAVSTVTTAQVNAEVLDVINVDTLIDGKTIKEAVRAIASTTTGKVSGAGTGTEVFVGMDGTTTRVTATVDSSGNRTAITYG